MIDKNLRFFRHQVTEPKELHGRTYKGFNFFAMNDKQLCEIIIQLKTPPAAESKAGCLRTSLNSSSA